MVLRKTVSREQLLSNSRAWRTTSRRTTSRRTTSHQRLARTAQTNLESLLLERLLLHLCVLARAHHRKGSLPRLCGERVLLRVINTLRPIGFGLPSSNQAQGEYTRSITEHARKECTDCYIRMFVQTTHYKQPNVGRSQFGLPKSLGSGPQSMVIPTIHTLFWRGLESRNKILWGEGIYTQQDIMSQ